MQNIVEYTGLELRRGVVPEAKLALGESKDQEEKMVKDRTLGNHNSIRVTGDIETRGTGCVRIISFVKDNVGGFRQVSCVVPILCGSVRHNFGATAPSNDQGCSELLRSPFCCYTA